MSAAKESKGRSAAPEESEGVLAKLPRNRPQRSSARRAAARKAASPNGAVKPETAKSPAKGAATKSPPKGATAKSAANGATPKRGRRNASARAAAAEPGREAVPRQGFECEGIDGALQPPGGGELIASTLEIVGEFAKAGFWTGERLIKDVLSRLPLS
jgi:hypothetical protein